MKKEEALAGQKEELGKKDATIVKLEEELARLRKLEPKSREVWADEKDNMNAASP